MSALNVPKATKNNPIYARLTKPAWMSRFYQICEQVGLYHQTPTAPAFAKAVYQWQKKSGLTADGMLGPKSWAIMEPHTRYSIDFGAPPAWITEMPPGWVPSTSPETALPPQPNGITDRIDQRIAADPGYANTLANSGMFVASLTLGKLKDAGVIGKYKAFGAGAVIQPLVWFYQGNTGDAWDKILYGAGLIPPLSLAAGAVGIWKGYLDDRTMKLVAEVQANEPSHLAKFIYPTIVFSATGAPASNAQQIASRGGVAWQHPNGVWVYLKLEDKGRPVMVCDYRPRVAQKILGPELPLHPMGNRFRWRSFKGGF